MSTPITERRGFVQLTFTQSFSVAFEYPLLWLQPLRLHGTGDRVLLGAMKIVDETAAVLVGI